MYSSCPSSALWCAVIVVIGIMWHYLYTHGGWWAVFKYWAMPYLVFNFWLSTYTYFHHRSAEIGWLTVCLVSGFAGEGGDYVWILDWCGSLNWWRAIETYIRRFQLH